MEFTQIEVEVIERALKKYIQIHLGMTPEVMGDILLDGIRSDGRKLTSEESLAAREHLESAQEILTGIRHGGPGIFSKIVPDEARLALRTVGRIEGKLFRLRMIDETGKATS